MNKEISMGFCVAILKRAWLVMLAVVIVVSAVAGVFTEFFIQKKYSSSVTFYVINSSGADYTSSSVVSALKELTANYMELLKTDKIVAPIAKKLADEHGINYTPDQIKRMVSTTAVNETAMIVLKVVHADRDVAFKIAELFSTEAPDLVTEIEKEELINNGVDLETGKSVTECIKAVNYPRIAETHDSPSLFRNVLLAAIVAAIAVYAIYFVIALLDNTIKSEDEIKECFGDYPLLASIPNWTNK